MLLTLLMLVMLMLGLTSFVIILPANLQAELCQAKQGLSSRKQIARQLRTQYVEGIYDNPVTLKSRLTVTQGHLKRNH